jgi:hypothetical protein
MDARTWEDRGPDDVRAGTRVLLTTFAALTLLAVVQLLVLADSADRFWAWPIRTELTAVFLGAAYTAGFVLSVLALRQHHWSQVRLPLLTVTAFTWLTAVPTVIHLHRLHLLTGAPYGRVVAWVWLAVYLLVPLACVVVVARQERHRTPAGPVLRPMPGWLAAVLGVEGVVLAAAGAALYGGGMTVHHHESAAEFWPWMLMPLSAQVIGAWLLSLGLAAALAVRHRDLDTLLVAGATYTAFGVFQLIGVFWRWPELDRHDVWLWSYLTILVAIVVTGGYGWWAARRPLDPPAEPGRSSPPAAAPAGGPGA